MAGNLKIWHINVSKISVATKPIAGHPVVDLWNDAEYLVTAGKG